MTKIKCIPKDDFRSEYPLADSPAPIVCGQYAQRLYA